MPISLKLISESVVDRDVNSGLTGTGIEIFWTGPGLAGMWIWPGPGSMTGIVQTNKKLL